jgi:hypothetical protein
MSQINVDEAFSMEIPITDHFWQPFYFRVIFNFELTIQNPNH